MIGLDKKPFMPLASALRRSSSKGLAGMARMGVPASARSSQTGGCRGGGGRAPAPDESGGPARILTFRADGLGRFSGNLEQEVEKKTEALNRRNAGLQFLSRVAQSAAWGAVFKRHSLDGLLEESCVQFGARAVRLVVSTDGTAAVLAESDAWPEEEPETGVVRFVLSDVNPSMGTLEALFDAEPEDGQTGFGEALAQTIGRGIERSTRQSDDRRLAVLEERSTIARELHDSIAQSLSYSRIQMHRLKVFVERGEPQEKVLETVNELSEGITTAYRQLREVLTTFRLQISSSGCLLYTSPSPRDGLLSRMPSSA